MFIVTVTFVIKKDKITDFEKVIKAQAHNSLHMEKGCLQFDVCFDIDNTRRVFLYEVYEIQEDFTAHLKTRHFLDFDQKVKDWLESKTAEKWLRYEPPAEDAEPAT